MKIYRAVFSYNNGDYAEWTEWYEKSSPWYTTREEAEKHLPGLNDFRDYVIGYFNNIKNYYFKYVDPKIEEVEVIDSYKPLILKQDEKTIFKNN